MFYIYRSTTRELADALNRIAEVGDAVLSCHHIGGRDWVVICRKGEPTRVERMARAAQTLGPGLKS